MLVLLLSLALAAPAVPGQVDVAPAQPSNESPGPSAVLVLLALLGLAWTRFPPRRDRSGRPGLGHGVAANRHLDHPGGLALLVQPRLAQLDTLLAQGAPWDLLLAGAVVLVLYFVEQDRADVLRRVGLERSDVALLTLGAVAGRTLNLPLFPLDGALFAVNLGGVLVTAVVLVRLYAAGRLSLGPGLVGAALVALATAPLVTVDPARGAAIGAPWFLVPPAVALVAGLLMARGRWQGAGPVALMAGTLGALVGADLVHLGSFVAVAGEVPAGTALVIGGAGAFDLVYLSGAVPLAVLVLGASLAVPAPPAPVGDPGAEALRVPSPRATLETLERLAGLSGRERCLAYLARADLALADEHPAQALAHGRRALAALLDTGQPALRYRLERHGRPEVVAELRELQARLAREHGTWLSVADTLERVKAVAGALWDDAGGAVRFGGLER